MTAALNKFFARKDVAAVAVTLAVSVSVAATAFSRGSFMRDTSSPVVSPLSSAAGKFSKEAKKIVETCAASEYKPTCYETEIPALMDHLSMEDAFEVTRAVQDIDPSYRYCHVLGHKLSAKESAKDPSKWKEVITRVPSGLCSNGGIHGAFQERYRKESVTNEAELQQIIPDLQDVCEAKGKWSPTGLEQASCYHALGHLIMYITEANAQRSVKLCDELAVKDNGQRNFSQVCYDGAFMQIFQPLEPDDFALIKGKEVDRDHHVEFCSKYDGWRRASCWNEGWPLYRSEIVTPEGATKFCTAFLTDPQHQGRCFDAMYYVVTAQFEFDPVKVGQFCGGMPENRQGRCFGSAATRLFETDYRNIPRSISLCTNVQGYSPQDACFTELLRYSTYNFHEGSPEFMQLCSGMPEPWQGKCLRRELQPNFNK